MAHLLSTHRRLPVRDVHCAAGVADADQAFLNAVEALADLEEKLPGLVRYMDPSDSGMHTTDTIDFEAVLESTVVLELDDGAEVTCILVTPWCRT